MKVIVDRTICTGHGRCYMTASAIFESDDEGFSVVALVNPPPELAELARVGAAACPEGAISVVE